MDALIQKGLRGSGLIAVTSLEMVGRYNACLKDMGLEETDLESFWIDATGWSREIGEEKDNQNYMSHGEANMLMIILSPEQRHCSVWNPYHSFDRDLIKQFFDNNRQQIAELTQRDGIWVDIDQEVDFYHDMSDLLFVDNIVVRVYTPNRLMLAARAQRDMIRRLMVAQDDFLSEARALVSIPTELRKSVRQVGAIAHRPMVIEDMPFTVPRSFYTRAFGGTFVLRSSSNGDALLLSKTIANKTKGVVSVTDKDILKKLEDLGLVTFEVERWIGEPHRLRIIRDSFLMDVLDKVEPKLDFVSLGRVQQKGLLNRRDIKKALPEEYILLNRVIQHLEKGKIPRKISPKIRPYLAHPIATLDKSIKEVVWYVLALECDGRNVVRLYRYDKDAFYAAYETWATPWRTFAVDCVQKYHQRRMV